LNGFSRGGSRGPSGRPRGGAPRGAAGAGSTTWPATRWSGGRARNGWRRRRWGPAPGRGMSRDAGLRALPEARAVIDASLCIQ